MDVLYHRGKLVFFALLLVGFSAIALYGLRELPEGSDAQFPRIFAVAIAAALVGLAVKFMLIVGRGRFLVLTVDPAGVTFHQPPLGTIPWTAIEDVVHKRSLLQRSLGFRFRAPRPRLPLLSRILYLTYRITESRPAHLYLPLPLLAHSDFEIAEALRRARRVASR